MTGAARPPSIVALNAGPDIVPPVMGSTILLPPESIGMGPMTVPRFTIALKRYVGRGLVVAGVGNDILLAGFPL